MKHPFPNSGTNAAYDEFGENGYTDFIGIRSDNTDPNYPSGASFDIVAHEYTHAVIHRTSNLGWDEFQKEPLALTEGFADIFGMLIQSRYQGWVSWNFGLQAGYQRNFYDPYNDVPSVSSSVYNDALWATSPSPYYRSGVLRKWFNHMSQGDWHWPVPYSGIGIDKAEKFAYNLMTRYLWQDAGFNFTRNQSLLLADELYGNCSPEWKAIQRAWFDVGIGSLSSCKPFGIRSGRVVSISQLSSSARPIRFEVVGNLLPAESDGITVSGYSWTLPSGWSGTFNASQSSFTLTSVPNYNSKKVSVVISYTENGTPKTTTLETVLHFSNDCPSISESKTPTSINASATTGQSISIYPNPTSKYVNIDIPENVENTEITVSDVVGRVVFTTNLQGRGGSISLPDNLTPGTYLLKIKNELMNLTEKLEVTK